MTPFHYASGKPVLVGDVVKIGHWDAVITGIVPKDDPEWDNSGGVSLEGPSFGAMRLEWINEDLVLVSRKHD